MLIDQKCENHPLCVVINENKDNFFSLLCELRKVSELRVAFCIVPEKSGTCKPTGMWEVPSMSCTGKEERGGGKGKSTEYQRSFESAMQLMNFCLFVTFFCSQ